MTDPVDLTLDCKHVKKWFAYQAQNRLPPDDNNWLKILRSLHESTNPKPRKRSLVHQFMHEEPKLIDTEFAILFKDGHRLDAMERMNKRYKIAKRLLDERYPHRNLTLNANAQEAHEKELQQWSLALPEIKLASDVDM